MFNLYLFLIESVELKWLFAAIFWIKFQSLLLLTASPWQRVNMISPQQAGARISLVKLNISCLFVYVYAQLPWKHKINKQIFRMFFFTDRKCLGYPKNY